MPHCYIPLFSRFDERFNNFCLFTDIHQALRSNRTQAANNSRRANIRFEAALASTTTLISIQDHGGMSPLTCAVIPSTVELSFINDTSTSTSSDVQNCHCLKMSLRVFMHFGQSQQLGAIIDIKGNWKMFLQHFFQRCWSPSPRRS